MDDPGGPDSSERETEAIIAAYLHEQDPRYAWTSVRRIRLKPRREGQESHASNVTQAAEVHGGQAAGDLRPLAQDRQSEGLQAIQGQELAVGSLDTTRQLDPAAV
jgi:hypothetical protein